METYMTQIWKHKALPIKAIMLSKAGKTIEMTRKQKMVKARMAIFMTPRKYMERPTSPELSATVVVCRPKRTSSVAIMGRALSGILVSGMMATKAHMKNVRTLG